MTYAPLTPSESPATIIRRDRNSLGIGGIMDTAQHTPGPRSGRVMTPEEARARVEAIREMADDDEDAHRMEDALRSDVLRAIANGSRYGRALSEIALTTSEIEFCRWYA